ncbi:hypothetical protein C8J56DRAFT_902053 [Mycena floridula]|nr:hypothetical protein C8J56DRAFT_902053 [Mycena floridula]
MLDGENRQASDSDNETTPRVRTPTTGDGELTTREGNILEVEENKDEEEVEEEFVSVGMPGDREGSEEEEDHDMQPLSPIIELQERRKAVANQKGTPKATGHQTSPLPPDHQSPSPLETLGTGLFRTARPVEGWPVRYQTLGGVLFNVASYQIRGCRETPEQNWIAALLLAGGSGPNGLLSEPNLVEELRECLTSLSDEGRHARIDLAVPEDDKKLVGTKGRYGPPHCFFIGGISETLQKSLLKEEVFLFGKHTSFLTFDINKELLSPSLMTITGHPLAPNSPSRDRELVLAMLKDCVRKNDAFRKLMAHISPGSSPSARVQFIEEVLGTFRLEHQAWTDDNKAARTGYRVFITVPDGISGDLYNEWLKTLRSVDLLSGPTRWSSKTTWKCNICKSDDHPTALCPFPEIGDDYAGPTKDTKFGKQARKAEEPEFDHSAVPWGERDNSRDGYRGRGRGRSRGQFY